MTEIHGKPSVINREEGGMAKWHGDLFSSKSGLHSITVEDMSLDHDFPAPHQDFLTYGYKLDIPRGYRQKLILSISDSIWYDNLKKVLYVRCHSHDANVGSIFTVLDILHYNCSDDQLYSINWSRYYAQNILYTMVKTDDGYGMAATADHAMEHLSKMENRIFGV